MSESEYKMVCKDRACGWKGSSKDILTAPNPFIPDDTLRACPRCREVGACVMACDEPSCWEPVSCGTPTKGGLPTFSGDPKFDGYRRTCEEHKPTQPEDGE